MSLLIIEDSLIKERIKELRKLLKQVDGSLSVKVGITCKIEAYKEILKIGKNGAISNKKK